MKPITLKRGSGKPRAAFCWSCSRRLLRKRGELVHYVLTMDDGTDRIVHKTCGQAIMDRAEADELVLPGITGSKTVD